MIRFIEIKTAGDGSAAGRALKAWGTAMRKIFKKGGMILEEGTSGSDAYIIESGKVRVFRSKSGKDVELAVLGENQIFGEMSMIDDRPRSASVAALEDTSVMVIGPERFNELFYSDPAILQVFLKNIFERLRNMDQAVIDTAIGMAAESYLEGRVFLSGLSPEAAAALGGKELEIKKFPLKVGRKTENFAKDIFSHNDLYLEDKRPYNVSRNHFSVQARMSKFFVVDRGSTLGTRVNDIRIGGPAGGNEIELEKGDNIVTAGDEESPYSFKVSIR